MTTTREEPTTPPERDDSWMPEILQMVHERLAAYLGAEHMKGCPPMFYDDAITNVAHRAAFGKLPEEMYPEGSLLHRLREAEAQVATLTSELSTARAAAAIATYKAVSALYFADSSDYEAGLYGVVKALAPDLWEQMDDGATEEHYTSTQAAAESAASRSEATEG